MDGQEHRVYRTRVDASGRIVLPSEARERNHIAEGDTVVVVEDTHGLHVKSLDQALAEAQDYFATLAPKSVVLSDALLADSAAPRASVTSVVLDASALIALLRREPGADVVKKRLADALISAVNYSEVLKKPLRSAACQVSSVLRPKTFHLKIVPFDEVQAAASAALYLKTKPHGMSFADRACLALGVRQGADVLTTDPQNGAYRVAHQGQTHTRTTLTAGANDSTVL